MPLVDPNLEILKLAVDQLGELVDEMVFLGGCATGLLVTDPAADPIRAIDDVGAIADVLECETWPSWPHKPVRLGFPLDVIERWLPTLYV